MMIERMKCAEEQKTLSPDKIKRRLEYWCRTSATDRHSWFDVEDHLMEIGAAKSFVEDVIRMLLERSQ